MASAKPIVKNAVAQEEPENSAVERKAGRFSLIWVVPLLALLLTGILIWNNTLNNGPEIKITTVSADGIEEGKTLVKIRSVNVGVVTDVVLAPDYRNTILTVQMDKNTEDFLRKDTKFWVVKPRIENAGISGLDTLLSGSYIQLSIGSSDEFATEFTALNEPPVRLNDEEGVMISLYTNESRKLGTGDIVSFRGFAVGAITETKLDVDTQQVHYQVFIREPYSKLVKPNTKFWISSGVDFSLDAAGLSLRTESLDNMVMGGLSFDNFVPEGEEEQVEPVKDNTIFRLYDRREDARLAALEGALLYVVMLEDSIYGIAPGSSVIYRGVKVGEVVKAPWFHERSEVFTSRGLPVMIAITTGGRNKDEIASILNDLLHSEHLCAQIGSANLVMSNNQINLVNDPKQKCSLGERMDEFASLAVTTDQDGFVDYRGYHVIPLIPTQSLSSQIDLFMEKLNDLDLAGVSDDLRASMQAFAGAMEAFTQSNNTVQSTQVISKLADAFENFNKSVRGYGPGTPVYESINNNLKNIEQILKDLSPTMTEMGQSPSSLIFGSPKDPIPMSPRTAQ